MRSKFAAFPNRILVGDVAAASAAGLLDSGLDYKPDGADSAVSFS